MDSIRDNSVKADFICELRLEFSADMENELCVVLVEGSSDVKLMKDLLEHNVVCKEVYAGKEALMELLDEDKLKKKNVIGIRDRDYADPSQFHDRLFAYDGCCMEIMLLLNQQIRDKFFKFYYKGDGESQSYVAEAMRALAPYSVLRRKNELEERSIRFQSGFGDLVRKDNDFQIYELFRRVGAGAEYEGCQAEADEIEDAELWNITNGHDICMYLGRLSRNINSILGEGSMQNILFGMYRKSDFEETQLYQDIFTYQEQNQVCFVS